MRIAFSLKKVLVVLCACGFAAFTLPLSIRAAGVTSIADLEATPTPTPQIQPAAATPTPDSGNLPKTGMADGEYILALASLGLVTASLIRLRQSR